MENRIQIDALEPQAFNAMFGLEKYLQEGQLNKNHYKLIKIRASQINGCAFCINMHTEEALKLGENPKRLLLLDAWWDTDLYSEEEQVILKITEEVTLVHENGLTQETYEKAMELFDGNYLAQIIMAVVTINAWNRIAISTHKPLEG
ncbi:carboxymuconolactone decarboxylase family protein [Muricauda sp. CAU 1633]|uniref:carboxymuconolactone decarboxylase family protein n=1 Tax=Allomuricauda sp. CAU 1633 TaxID=2816036 RepID=UPI001A8D6F73|nr:carboxymuconolactone decarboxylase family protein [Muricauda sp. CAU 1633]MBO0322423.1 carboxymuconolactone decarboxylase family protein [Muricauda sp. CAU 1633]